MLHACLAHLWHQMYKCILHYFVPRLLPTHEQTVLATSDRELGGTGYKAILLAFCSTFVMQVMISQTPGIKA